MFCAAEVLACLGQGAGTLVLRRIDGFVYPGLDGYGFGNISMVNPFKMVERAFYGQVQVINSLLHIRPFGDYLTWNLLVLAAILGLGVFLLVCIVRNRHRQTAVYAAVLILLSFGTAALRILSNAYDVSSGWSTVMYIYRDRFWMFCFVGWFGVAALGYVCAKRSDVFQRERCCRIAVTTVMAVSVLLMCSTQLSEGDVTFYDKYEDPGDWDNYYQMAGHDTYAIQINPSGWHYQSPDCRILIATAGRTTQAEANIDTELAASVYARKDTFENQLTLRPYYVNVYDGNGQLAARVPQVSDPAEHWAGFDVNTPVSGISRLEFTYEDGTPAFINGEYQVCYRG